MISALYLALDSAWSSATESTVLLASDPSAAWSSDPEASILAYVQAKDFSRSQMFACQHPKDVGQNGDPLTYQEATKLALNLGAKRYVKEFVNLGFASKRPECLPTAPTAL
jgi:hypothetical protein